MLYKLPFKYIIAHARVSLHAHCPVAILLYYAPASHFTHPPQMLKIPFFLQLSNYLLPILLFIKPPDFCTLVQSVHLTMLSIEHWLLAHPLLPTLQPESLTGDSRERG